MSKPPGTGGEAGGDLAASLALLDQFQRALARNDRAGIVDCVRQFIERRLPVGSQWQQIANIAAENAELGLAREAMEQYVKARGGDAVSQYQHAGFLAAIGSYDQAYALLSSVPENVPDPAINAYSRGAAGVFVGEVDEARQLLERVTVLRPDLGQAWLPLSTLVDFAGEPALAERIIGAERVMERTPPDAQAVYNYALGKAYADLGEHALAFAAFAKGARLKKAERGYDRAQDRLAAEEAVRGYDRERIAAIAGRQSEPTARSIFVTGMPRSGTTLMEQILTSHSTVSDGGEINRLMLLSRDIGGTAWPALSRYVDEQGAPAAARLWSHWLDERFPAPGRIVDKSIDTGRFLGLAAALLPEAPLIWLTRDPLDCAWSCFRTHFLGGVLWSYDLEDIAFYFRLEEQLRARWQEILGERLLVVPYESLVSDPAPWIGRILAHCGLAEEPQAFVPHENPRAVTTSSVMQVRRPINRGAVGAAEPYRQWLEPFIAAYGA